MKMKLDVDLKLALRETEPQAPEQPAPEAVWISAGAGMTDFPESAGLTAMPDTSKTVH